VTAPDWTPAHIREALRLIGRKHLSAATVAVLACPKDHNLDASIIATHAGPLYMANVVMPKPHSTGLRELGRRVRRAHGTVMALHTRAYLAAMTAAGLVDWWPASCACGLWEIPHTLVVEIAEKPPKKKRLVIDTERVRRSGALHP
jgi:type IV secretory pathway TrbD component